MADFLWKEISEKEKIEIKEQAKKILDGFSKKLSRINVSKISEPQIKRKECERKEGIGKQELIDRKIMFENAPEKNSDFIIAEKIGRAHV